MDMIRKTNGKRTLSASEKEEKGKGLRMKKRKVLEHPVLKEATSPDSREDSSSEDESAGKSEKNQQTSTPPLELTQKSRVSKTEKCPCATKQHKCSFGENGDATLSSLANALCSFSSKFIIRNL